MKIDITSYIQLGSRFYGVEQTQSNDANRFYGLSLKKQRNKVNLETCFESSNLEDLKLQIPKGKPIVLVINTNSVLTKKVESKRDDALKLVHKAFPNISIDEFYYESLSQGENHFVSICRKSYVDDLLNLYASKQISIVDFTLGNLICSNVSPYIDSDVLQTSNASLYIKEKLISNIELVGSKSELIYNVNGLDIKNNYMLSCSAALNTILNSQNIQSSYSNKRKALNTVFKHKNFARKCLKIGLSTLFIILLINILFFNHYYSAVSSLRQTNEVLEKSKTKMVRLSEEIKKNEKTVTDILKNRSSKSSFYIDDIINQLPETIILSELNYQPLLKKIKKGSEVENQKYIIIISGQISEVNGFSLWVAQLESTSWIVSVDILSFEDIAKSSSSFTIKIHMKDDSEI
ncbi:hypothetical protein [uncultured Psychroserpens sp.]|uniref:hypothetical protein n=1 Tax=uncultured Psychroserpens sp. TaxID=255436 RepID=UPI002625577A|nr:hypothetical protein [uncultured Psychroserpens sp.]